MKKFSSIFLAIVLFFSALPAYGAEADSVTVEYLENGYYIVTVIEDIPSNTIQPMSMKTETKSKTAYVKNDAGKTLWYVRVTGTFTYGNGTARCTSAIPSAASQDSAWKVSDITGGKFAATAYASATGKQYLDGSVINSISKTVSLTCSPTGVFS